MVKLSMHIVLRVNSLTIWSVWCKLRTWVLVMQKVKALTVGYKLCETDCQQIVAVSYYKQNITLKWLAEQISKHY